MNPTVKQPTTEAQIQRRIFRVLGGHPDVRLFRNNVAMAWTGDAQRLQDGSVLIRNPRPLHAGLHRGSGDLIGWRRRIVTPQDVGCEVAQFLSLEIKTPKGRPTADQKNWADVVRGFGGLAGIVRSELEAEAVIDGALLRPLIHGL